MINTRKQSFIILTSAILAISVSLPVVVTSDELGPQTQLMVSYNTAKGKSAKFFLPISQMSCGNAQIQAQKFMERALTIQLKNSTKYKPIEGVSSEVIIRDQLLKIRYSCILVMGLVPQEFQELDYVESEHSNLYYVDQIGYNQYYIGLFDGSPAKCRRVEKLNYKLKHYYQCFISKQEFK